MGLDAEELFRTVIGSGQNPERRLPRGHVHLPDGAGGPRIVPVGLGPDPDLVDHPFYVEIEPPAREEFERGYAKDGIEFLAVYAPYTFFGLDWGIYYFANRIYQGLSVLVERDPALGVSAEALLNDFMLMVEEHELVHFRVELAATLLRVGSGFDHYRLYKAQHGYTVPGSDAMEEAVATAHELAEGRLWNRRLARAVAARLQTAPKGYRDHGRFRSPAALDKGHRTLISRVVGRGVPTAATPPDLLDDAASNAHERSVPRYLLSEGPLPPWFEQLLEGRRTRQVRLSDILRHARRHASVVTGGRHPYKVVLGGRSVPLQDHPRINRDYPEHILKQLAELFGMTRDAYLNAVLSGV